MRLPCARHISSSECADEKLYGTRGARAPVWSIFPDDGAATDREIDTRGEDLATRVAREEAHGIAVIGQRMVDDLPDVPRRVEADTVLAVEQHAVLGLGARVALAQRRAVATLGDEPLEPGDDGGRVAWSRPLNARPP